MSVIEKRKLRDSPARRPPQISVKRQCELLDLARSVYYYQPATETAYNLELMRRIDEQYMRTPYYGVGMMYGYLRRRLGHQVNVKRVRRLYRKMGLEAIYPKPNLSRPNAEHKVYPYLLRNVAIERVNQVWSMDITYMPMKQGFLYLTAVMDWYSRCVLSWELSNSLDVAFCLTAVETALARHGNPEIFNTDQGSQFTSHVFTKQLLDHQIQVSMDGKGRATDNAFVERLWRSVKRPPLRYDYLYLHVPESGTELYKGLAEYFEEYNHSRPHSSLGYRTPAEVYFH